MSTCKHCYALGACDCLTYRPVQGWSLVALSNRIRELENWKESSEKSTLDWQEVGKALGLQVGTDVSKALLPAIWNLRNEVELYKIQAKMSRYGMDCACLWEGGKVVGTCAAHGEVLRDAEDRLAEKYRKLTESK